MPAKRAAQRCAWCDAPVAYSQWWLCQPCDETPWPRGARFVLRQLWFATPGDPYGRGLWQIMIQDRAYNHRIVHVPAGRSSSGDVYRRRARCRDLNLAEPQPRCTH